MSRARRPAATIPRLALLALALGAPALAAPREMPGAIVWSRGERAYFVASDSASLAPGLVLTIGDRRRTIATGVIAEVVDGTLAVVRLTSGTLARVRKLDRLRVLGERPAPASLPMLRAGFPAGARANLAFDCGEVRPGLMLGPLPYRLEPRGADVYWMIRLAPPESGAPWPDTLSVRLFREAADEEIALERGELDVAVFWPGELSARMRNDARWRDAPRGLRAQGVIATIAPAGAPRDSGGAPPLDPALAALNAEMFGGDLLDWARLDSIAAGAAPPAAERYLVDAAMPGQKALQRFLDHGAPAGAGDRAARLAYLDVPLAARGSLAPDWRARGVTPRFALRCPVLAAPDLRAYVASLGADAFAAFPVCAPPGRRP